MERSKTVYRELVTQADDIGGNPMACNELFVSVFTAPYVASKKILPTTMQEMMRHSLYPIQ